MDGKFQTPNTIFPLVPDYGFFIFCDVAEVVIIHKKGYESKID